MLANLKVKVRSSREDPSRRIRTQTNQNPRRVSFYQPTVKPRPPLAEQRPKNTSDCHTLNLKKPKVVRTIPLKSMKLQTDTRDKTTINQAQRSAIHQLFAPNATTSKKQSKELPPKVTLSGANRYSMEQKVGSGTFGVVHKARDKKTLEQVAIKRVFQDKKYKNRQLQILKTLDHANVLKMKDSFYTYEGEKEYLNVVMDYYPYNLFQALQNSRKAAAIVPLQIKVWAYQLFKGLVYLDRQRIAHRDMKPQNVLVDQHTWKLLICDFGSAKKLTKGENNLAYICSRCYRAPQLIFGSTTYDCQIDMWSAGCILAEMVTLEPIFRSDSNIDQLVEIVKVLGTPSHAQILEMNPDCDPKQYQFPAIQPRPWDKVLKRKHPGSQFLDLLSKILRYSPKQRLTARQALKHAYFDELKEEGVRKQIQKQWRVSLPDRE